MHLCGLHYIEICKETKENFDKVWSKDQVRIVDLLIEISEETLDWNEDPKSEEF